MKVIINKDLCVGCGSCVVIAPEVFEFDGEVSKVKEGVDLASYIVSIKKAAEACPSGAIQLEEE